MPKHAKLSASGAELWTNCPGSVHMAELFPETTSPAAEEGTLAHALAQTMIENARDGSTSSRISAEYMVERDKVNAFYSVHKELAGSFDDMKTVAKNVGKSLRTVRRQVARAIQAGEIQQVKHGEYKKL